MTTTIINTTITLTLAFTLLSNAYAMESRYWDSRERLLIEKFFDDTEKEFSGPLKDRAEDFRRRWNREELWVGLTDLAAVKGLIEEPHYMEPDVTLDGRRLSTSYASQEKIHAYITRHCETLESISIQHSSLSDELVEQIIASCPHLTNLDLYECTGIKFPVIVSKTLQRLVLVHQTTLTKGYLNQLIVNCPNLNYVRLRGFHEINHCTIEAQREKLIGKLASSEDDAG